MATRSSSSVVPSSPERPQMALRAGTKCSPPPCGEGKGGGRVVSPFLPKLTASPILAAPRSFSPILLQHELCSKCFEIIRPPPLTPLASHFPFARALPREKVARSAG